MQCSKFFSDYCYVSLDYSYNNDYLIVNKMIDCAAPNYSECFRKGDRFFSFSNDIERCKRWLVNCRRNFWVPSKYSKFCEVSAYIMDWVV